MEKLLTKKNIIIMAVVCVVVILMGVFYITLQPAPVEENKPSEDIIGNDDIYNPVSPTEAVDFYSDVVSTCDGVMILENNENSCKSNNDYKQKMIGYSYDGEDLVVYVNVMHIENGHGYKLDGTDLGIYSEDKESELLEGGTTYLYTYQKNNDNYTFSNMKLME